MPRILDLYCGAGGASMGYHQAGFEVVGVDIAPQPRYPFEFIQEDAIEFSCHAINFHGFDAVHASPPCQQHVRGFRALNTVLGRELEHVNLIPQTRELLRSTGLPYIIENVVGAELEDPVKLCGSSFGLPIRRHRMFESNIFLMVPPCNHSWQRDKKYWNGDRSQRLPDGTRRFVGPTKLSTVVQIYGNSRGRQEWPEALGIDWMVAREMIEAIPPAYTELLGTQLLEHIHACAKT